MIPDPSILCVMERRSELLARVLVLAAFAVVLGVPWLFRPETARVPEGAQTLVILTPHNEQIRYEFARAFDQWHRTHHGSPAVIDWRFPGGTTEIRRLLVAQYTAALQTGRITKDGELAPGAEPMAYDMLFGGGSFEHGEVKKGVRALPPGAEKEVALPMSVSMAFDQQTLDAWFGENKIGPAPLYDPGDSKASDPGQYWLGTAVSGFGIVFNRDVLRSLELPDPTSWNDLTSPKLIGWVALADPRQSGSVATALDSVLSIHGWDEGWRILRAMSANARYFSNSSPKPPLDVSQGQAAVGTAIDFLGRYQSQAVMRPGETPETSRVGYIDPPGATQIDPDPISMLRGGPNPALAKRFVEFVLSEEGQALWNFPARPSDDPAALGPERFEIRRLPIRRVMYEKHFDRFVDKVKMFEIASQAPPRGWRSAVGPMIGAFSIDVLHEQTAAWRAMARAAERGVDPAALERCRELFFAWPEHVIPAKGDQPEKKLVFSEQNYREIRADWRDAEKDGRMARILRGYTAFFRENYRQIVRLLDDDSIARANP